MSETEKRLEYIQSLYKQKTHPMVYELVAMVRERDAHYAECERVLAIAEKRGAQLALVVHQREIVTEALEHCKSLCYSWFIAEQTIDCKHTYTEIAETVRRALVEISLVVSLPAGAALGSKDEND